MTTHALPLLGCIADDFTGASDLANTLATSGMSTVQFGIVMLINCALGLNTPPVGVTQFVGCAIGGISVGEVMKSILPFYGALTLCLMLVTYVPAFSLWLPSIFNAPLIVK